MSLRRASPDPLIVRTAVPDMPPDVVDPSGVFNPGAVAAGEADVLLLRVQTRGRRTFTVPARVERGTVAIAERPVEFDGLELSAFHVYDPRITATADGLLVTTAVDTEDGCRLAVWRAAGSRAEFAKLDRLECVGMSAHPDTRNGVILPERIGGRHLMLERPNRPDAPGQPGSGSRIVLSATEDFTSWEDLGPVMSGRPHFWDELIGPGPPPVKTRHGWLLVYHGIATHFAAANLYQAGAALLDRDDPRLVLARTRDNVLEPRKPWELTGQVPGVVFPTGLTVAKTDAEGFAPDEAELRVYYGAADTCIGLATTTVGELVHACLNA